MVVRALQALADRGEVDRSTVQAAIDKYQLLDPEAGDDGQPVANEPAV